MSVSPCVCKQLLTMDFMVLVVISASFASDLSQTTGANSVTVPLMVPPELHPPTP